MTIRVQAVPTLAKLDHALDRAVSQLLSTQTPGGYWWFTLEANESINAEYIFLEHCLGIRTPKTWERLAQRMLDEQLADGGWTLAHGEPADVSITLECYVALRMAGFPASHPALKAAHACAERLGGLANARVFTQIHFAMMGIVPWSTPPTMPIELMLLPHWSPVSIYSFSSWARACVVPLLVVFAKQPTYPIDGKIAAELPVGDARGNAKFRRDIWSDFFTWGDRLLKLTRPVVEKLPTKEVAMERAVEWIRTHIARTEDIFPALAYAAHALHALGYAHDDPTIAKSLAALRRFQHGFADDSLPCLPFALATSAPPALHITSATHAQDTNADTQSWEYFTDRITPNDSRMHQQCCISPGWDTPWAMCALRASGVSKHHPSITHAAQWLKSQQVTTTYGDWQKKNPDGEPGGWSFEFENDFFPDLDDTIQIILALEGQGMESAVGRAVRWCLSMQNDDGGCGAFDKNNQLELLNKIPFADHGACLDPSTPDITGRFLLMLARQGYSARDRAAEKALRYLQRTQETDGSWWGRWGVNYVYGTWAVLTGLHAMQWSKDSREVRRAAQWLLSVQQSDGGFGESVAGYARNAYVPAPASASQTAWGLMGLIAAGHGHTDAAHRAAEWLLTRMHADGTWEERAFTGTGFPGHFYLRYHGYRAFFPVLALGKYRSQL